MTKVRREAGFDAFGTPRGVSEGDAFRDRRALYAAGVHCQLRAGIHGTKATGAESVVLSGGYEDDEDYGSVIIYTGQGGRDEDGRHVADQDPEDLGNAALITSAATALPVRVTRGSKHRSPYSPNTGYRYDGLYRVESHWQHRRHDGFLVCRYRMVRVTPSPQPDIPVNTMADERRTTTTQRIVRSGTVVQHVKALHDNTCQFCGTRLTVHGRGYSEGAHIRPLGRPHDGPDTEDNLLCLCANCHVLFDLGGIVIEKDMRVIVEGSPLGILRAIPGHNPSQAHLEYHRRLHSDKI
jgi:HNH endonuclease./YDG/SRA domain.